MQPTSGKEEIAMISYCHQNLSEWVALSSVPFFKLQRVYYSVFFFVKNSRKILNKTQTITISKHEMIFKKTIVHECLKSGSKQQCVTLLAYDSEIIQ